MSFLKIGDRAAGAIKSGGTTRRAAKMVCLDLDHPDVEKFVNWKVREELKVAAMAEGIKHLRQGAAGDRQEARPQARLRLQRRSVLHRQRPELEQLRPHPQRVLQGRRGRRRLAPDLPHRRQGRQDAQGPRPVGADRLRRVALRRPGRAVRRHDQPVAHLPASPAASTRQQPLRHRRHARAHARRHLAAHRPDDPPAVARRHQPRRPGDPRHRRRVPHRHQGRLRARAPPAATASSSPPTTRSGRARRGWVEAKDLTTDDEVTLPSKPAVRAGDRRAAGPAVLPAARPVPQRRQRRRSTRCTSTRCLERPTPSSEFARYVARELGRPRSYADDYVNDADGRPATPTATTDDDTATRSPPTLTNRRLLSRAQGVRPHRQRPCAA